MPQRSPERRAYITGVDQRFLGRALTMVASLRHFEPDAVVFLLCFDPATARTLRQMPQCGLTPIDLETILAFEPRLEACRDDRTPHGFYDTTRGPLARYVLQMEAGFSSVTWLDADLLFFSDPQAIFDEIGDAPIAITPHHFKADDAFAQDLQARYGVYNSGFLHWKNDVEALRCLDAYIDDCLDWCDTPQNAAGSWLGQVYLNSWTARYAGVCEIQNPGVNLGHWNLNNHSVQQRDGAVWIDEARLVFFHYSGVFLDPQQVWRTKNYQPGRSERATMTLLYLPYVARLDRNELNLKRRFPKLLQAVAPPSDHPSTPLQVSRPWILGR